MRATTIYGLLIIMCGVALVVSLVWLFLFSTRHMKGEKVRRLGDRQAMSSNEFYETYYLSTALPSKLVSELVNRLGEALEIPPGLLRPGDRFEVELAPLKGWSFMDDRLDLFNLMSELERKYKIQIDRSGTETVDQLIRAVGKGAELR